MDEEQKSSASAKVQMERSQGFALESAMDAASKTDDSQAFELLKTFAVQALPGTITFDRDLPGSIENAIMAIDEKISKQLVAIMHHPVFQELEGTWRGLRYLVMNSKTSTDLRIRVLNCSKSELQVDLESAVEYDQSEFFKSVYTSEFCSPGGTPYAAMIGDYEFTNHPDDIEMLTNISKVAAAAFCPFISSASPNMFGFVDWTELDTQGDLRKIFDSDEYANWNTFRESDDSRFVVLTLPRTLSRRSYGAHTKPIEEFNLEEVELGENGEPTTAELYDYCWMNTAYVMGARLTDAFAQSGWCMDIRGWDAGGKVEDLPTRLVKCEYGDFELKCATDGMIADRRENEIGDCGFLTLCHSEYKDGAVFLSGQTAQKPKAYEGEDGDDATANAGISARLPYVMASSRWAHYIQAIALDNNKRWVGIQSEDKERWLMNWIGNYVSGHPLSRCDQRSRMRLPLEAARIEVRDLPDASGKYDVVVLLRHWMSYEKLVTSMQFVVKLPSTA